MDKLLIYLLQASAGSVLLYLVYYIFYRNDTFYLRNRVILLLAMAVPVVIPLLSISGNLNQQIPEITGNLADWMIFSGISNHEPVSQNMISVSFTDIVFWIWLSGTVLLIIRTCFGLLSTFLIIRKGERCNSGKTKIIISDFDHQPFSFFSYSVLPRKLYEGKKYEKILIHEMAHIAQLHTIDLIVSELFIAFFWFNPVAWLIKKSMVLNHEYLADAQAISKSASAADYQFELLSIPEDIKKIRFAHNYNSNLKNRILMINKNSTCRIARLKNLIVLPAVIILLLMFSFKPEARLKDPSPQQALFSAESQSKLLAFLFTNLSYPEEAKKDNITGRFFVIVNMGKGGKVGKISTNDKDNNIDIPLVSYNEVVITGYDSSENPGVESGPADSEKNADILENEAVRVAKRLGSLDLPEWKDKNMEFAFSINFQLKSRGTLAIRNKGELTSANPLIVVDGKELPFDELNTIEVSAIANMTVLKSVSATKKYGEKGKNGVIEITLK